MSSLIFILHYHRYTLALQNYPELENLKPTSLVLTGNLRLARFLQEAYGHAQLAAGNEAWAQPAIMHWQSWLKQSWQEVEHHSKHQLLTDPQARLVWEQVIRDHLDEHFSLLNLHASARSAQSAWRLLHDYGCSLDNLGQQLDEDVMVFQKWAQAYGKKCQQHHWLDEARLGDHVYNSIAADQLTLPGEVIVAGIDEPTPLQQKIFSQLEAKGVTVSQLETSGQAGKQSRLSFLTTRDEIQASAQWAKKLLNENSETPKAIKVAIVIPNLVNVRADVVRIFDQVLCPDNVLPGKQDQPRPYDISLGLPIGSYPIVFDALLILECLSHRLPLEKVGRLLASSFVGGAIIETNARALLDAWLREKGETSIRIDIFAREAKGLNKNGEAGSHACPELAAMLATLVALKQESMPTRQSCHDWAKLFTKVLSTALGWPGERELSSTEFQTVERFREILESFAGMENISGLITLHEAISQLRNLANETIFQPKSDPMPIIVMDVQEEKVLSFDALWVMGLHDEVWPPAPRPHPLLPVSLQREQGMPHASAEKELQDAHKLTRAFLESAGEVIVSSPERDGDKDLRPSPLITNTPQVKSSGLNNIIGATSKDIAKIIYQSGYLESLNFDQAPPLISATKTRGGTGLIKQQAQCPFSAFARYRLGAQPLSDYQSGLSAMERGSLVHRVLELLWGEIKSQEILLAYSEAALDKTITQHVTRAIDEQAAHRPETFTPKFVEIETTRLSKLMSQWLVLEKERAPFKVVAPEEEQFVTIAGMTLKLIIDRIDEIESGELLLIDYKTGSNNNINSWFDDRPKEPQLPMYSYLGNEQGQAPAALAFAQLAVGDQKFIGLGNQDGIANGIKDIAKDDKHGAVDWDAQINDWKNVLENLAQQYVNGDAKVDPRDDNSCAYCPYPELCRIHELNQRLGHLMEASEE